MKRIMCRVGNIFAFEFPFELNVVTNNFSQQHLYYKSIEPGWHIMATRKKLICQFWLRHVTTHYGLLVFAASILLIPFVKNLTDLSGIFAGATLALIIMIAIFYYPRFYSDFLTRLDAIVAQYEKLEVEQNEPKKCKRTQFSIPTLTIIYFVLSKTSDISMPSANDTGAALLNNLFGVDKDKLKQNLVRLLKISELSAKERAEFVKGISAARDFFTAVSSKSAEPILNQLELKVNRV